eukprot:350500-Chlamydomonas_euryale.AAC.18
MHPRPPTVEGGGDMISLVRNVHHLHCVKACWRANLKASLSGSLQLDIVPALGEFTRHGSRACLPTTSCTRVLAIVVPVR